MRSSPARGGPCSDPPGPGVLRPAPTWRMKPHTRCLLAGLLPLPGPWSQVASGWRRRRRRRGGGHVPPPPLVVPGEWMDAKGFACQGEAKDAREGRKAIASSEASPLAPGATGCSSGLSGAMDQRGVYTKEFAPRNRLTQSGRLRSPARRTRGCRSSAPGTRETRMCVPAGACVPHLGLETARWGERFLTQLSGRGPPAPGRATCSLSRSAQTFASSTSSRDEVSPNLRAPRGPAGPTRRRERRGGPRPHGERSRAP